MGTCCTAADARPETAPARAVISVLPFPVEVTSPDLISTRATVGRRLTHWMLTLAMGFPYWSNTRAESCSVSPTETKETSDGVTVTVVGIGGSTGSSPPQAQRTAARRSGRGLVEAIARILSDQFSFMIAR